MISDTTGAHCGIGERGVGPIKREGGGGMIRQSLMIWLFKIRKNFLKKNFPLRNGKICVIMQVYTSLWLFNSLPLNIHYTYNAYNKYYTLLTNSRFNNVHISYSEKCGLLKILTCLHYFLKINFKEIFGNNLGSR